MWRLARGAGHARRSVVKVDTDSGFGKDTRAEIKVKTLLGAMYLALQPAGRGQPDRRLAGAGLDVFEVEPLPDASPLWDMPNVIVTPRVGGMSDTYAQQALPLVEENLRLFLAGDLAHLRNIVQR